MTSKLSSKPCQVDVKIDPNLDNGVSVVSAFIVVRVDGSIVNVGLDSSAGIHVSGVGRELGVVHVFVDVEVGGNLVVAAIFGVCSMKDFSSLFSTTPSKLDKDVELDILVLWWDGVVYVGLRKFFIEKKSCVDSWFSTCTM